MSNCLRRISILLVFSLLLFIFFCGFVAAPDKGKVLNDTVVDGRIPVIVVLEDDVFSLSDRRLRISRAQERVISGLDEGEFMLGHRYSVINGFSGRVTEEGLEKLLRDPLVKGVYIDGEKRILVDESVPLINATDTWGLQVGGVGITGKGETICVIDTGIDYRHPDLGDVDCMKKDVNGSNESYSLESAHPYANSFDYTWNITKPGYASIAVHFVNIGLEYGFDSLYVRNSTGGVVEEYTGYYEDEWSLSVPGETVLINLVTDSSITEYGFRIDQVLNGTSVKSGWTNCGRIVGGYDFVNSDDDPLDDHGHGTHCAGIAAANGSIKGVAPDANIVAIKVCDFLGSCPDSFIIAGIDWCVSNASLYNISVISMSLGGGVYSNYCDASEGDFASAINYAVANNISVVIASGNDYYTGGISSPACIRNATPVGSVDDGSWGTTADVISSFTNRGSGFPEMLLAPGSWITSAVPGGGYDTWEGTSMATPHVAGAVALVKQYLGLLNQDQITQEIKKLFNDTGKRIYDSGTGLYFSRIDVYSAVMELEKPPVVYLNSPGDGFYMKIDDTLLNWTCVDPEGGNMTSWVYGDNATATTLLATVNCSSNVSNIFNWTGLNETVYYWKVTCKDNLSSTSSETWSFGVDMTPPTVSFIPPTPANGSNTDFNMITFNVSHLEGSPDTLVFYLNGVSEYLNYSGVYSEMGEVLANGLYNYSVWLNDSAGNMNQTGFRYLVVNATPPSVSLVSPENNSFSDGTVNLTCNASDNVQLYSVSLYWNYSGVWGVDETENVSGNSASVGFLRSGLNDSFFEWNCFACDNSSNCAFSTENLHVIVDSTPPVIVSYSINPKVAINGSNVSLSLNAADSYLDTLWAVVDLPDLSQVVVGIPAEYPTNMLGEHNVSFYANDSAGNEAFVGDYFIVGDGMVFNSSFLGFNNTLLNVTLRAFFDDSLIASNQSLGNVSLTIANYVYDLQFSTFNNSLVVLLKNVNLSQNNNRTIGFDWLTSVLDYLVTYAVNSSYQMENATLNLSYAGLDCMNSDFLAVYRCALWDFAARSCSGVWEKVNASNFPDDEYFLLNVSGFSGFSINQEPYCGDGFIDAGEQCDGSNFGGKTCQSFGFDYGSLSCSGTCTISTNGCKYYIRGGGSPSGGGGGGYSVKVTISCFDGIKNCHDGSCEEGIDCGGPCRSCPSCSDGILNQGETGIDCGGPCRPCSATTSTRYVRSTTSTSNYGTLFIGSSTSTSTSIMSPTASTPPRKTKVGYEALLVAVFVLAVLVFTLRIRYIRHVSMKAEEETSDLKDAVLERRD